MYIDTHAHLTMFDDLQIAEILRSSEEACVKAIINPSFDFNSAKKGIEIASKNLSVYAGVGIHPHDAWELDKEGEILLRSLASDPRVVAIGETGLDYYKCDVSHEIQAKVFVAQILLAMEMNLPLIIHCRDADEDMIKILSNKRFAGLKGVFHCFAGDKSLLQFAIDNNFYLSFTGNITFKKAHIIRESLALAPINRIMIETDSPYLAPEPHRGKTNTPVNIPLIASAVANIRGVGLETIAKETTENAIRFFNLKI